MNLTDIEKPNQHYQYDWHFDVHRIPLLSSILRAVIKEQHRSKQQTEYQKWDRSQGTNFHNSGELCPQKIQWEGNKNTCRKEHDNDPHSHPDALDMVMPAGAVLLTPLDGAFLLVSLLGLLFHVRGQGCSKIGAFKPLCKPWDPPHICFDGG